MLSTPYSLHFWGWSSWGGPTHHVLNPRLPHQLATVCEDWGLSFVLNNLQYRGLSWTLSCSPCTLQTIAGLIRDEDNRAYRELIKDFKDFHLQLSARKTKELVVDFQWKASSILGCPLDSVQMVGESRMMDKLS